MKRTDFTYLSTDNKTEIHGVIWQPEGEAKGIIQIAHGITEHIGRHEKTAEYFTDRGYIVAGNDHLGHGKSVDKNNPLTMYFGPEGSWDFVTEDVAVCTGILKEKFPHLPLCLLGFSLGSFAVRCLIAKYPHIADMSIWAGTGQTSAAERAVAGAVARFEQLRFGDKKNTPLLHKLTMETYNKGFAPCRTGADWLCANQAAVDDYLNDPLCGDGFTVGSFRELLTGMKISAQNESVEKLDKNMPVLLLSGGDDPVGGMGKGVEKVYSQLRNHGMNKVEKHLFDGMRHDIFHEQDYIDVLKRMEGWIENNLTE